MRSWGIASILVFASSAAAEPTDLSATTAADNPASAAKSIGYAALPGGLRAPSADTLPAGTFAVSAIGGYGVRHALLSADHTLQTGVGDFALAYAPAKALTIALSFDGRIDKHVGSSPIIDHAYVGGPHLLARLATSRGNVRVGGQLGIYLPGSEAPSIVPGATTVDARGLFSIKLGAATLSLAAGFRYDNTSKSVDPELRADMSSEDRVSLGISDFHALLGSIHAMIPIGKAFIGLETSADVFVGAGALGPIIRGGGTFGVHLGSAWSAFAFAQAAKVPSIDHTDAMAATTAKLIAYEPALTSGVGVAAQFGGRTRATKPRVVVAPPPITPDKPKPVERTTRAVVVGSVVDDHGKPIAGAKVTIKLQHGTGSATTDDKGGYTIADLPIRTTLDDAVTLDDADGELTGELDTKLPKTIKVALVEGLNNVGVIVLPPVPQTTVTFQTQVRAAPHGDPILNATVKVEPGGLTMVLDPSTTMYKLELPLGNYTITASAPKHKAATKTIVIDKIANWVENFELVRERR